ncbi:MAG: FtsW/RodA/SpoVE family cell cycle protein [Planctomycetota bacterium]
MADAAWAEGEPNPADAADNDGAVGRAGMDAVPGVIAPRLYDPVIVFLAGVLMSLGAVMVYSASATVEGVAFELRDWWHGPLKQAVFAVAGFLVMLVAAHLDYRVFAWRGRLGGWRAGLLLVLSVVLLLAVFAPGVGESGGGARRAISVRGLGFSFQPAELAKTALVVWLAALLTRPVNPDPADGGVPRGHILHFTTGFLPAVATGGLLIALTGIEDFGTAALMGVVMLLLLYLGRARFTHLALLGIAGLAAGGLLIWLKPHRLGRILTWFSEDPDPAGAGYQISQALLAIGSGGWFGRGLGAGVQKYGYLPQDNNDFILAIICEELGVVGGATVVVLFLAVLLRGWRLAEQAADGFGRLLALGLTLTICLQAAMNIGVVTNSIPTKGISLPFVSSGGSGVVFLGLAAGLLAAVGRTRGVGNSVWRAAHNGE